MRLTAPSVRNSASSMRRAPSPRAVSAVLRRAASRSTVASTSSSRAIGSGKRFSATIGRDRQQWRERLVFAAERAVELAQQVGAEARGERRARQVDDVADALEADAGERRDGVGRQPQRGERQRRERVALFGRCNVRRIAEARHRPGRADGRRDGGARREAEARHPRKEIVAQLCLAAEQMRAAADVEQDAVGRIDGDERRIALAASATAVEQARVGGRILRHGRERGMHGARLREREAGTQAEPLRRRHRPRPAASALPRRP